MQEFAAAGTIGWNERWNHQKRGEAETKDTIPQRCALHVTSAVKDTTVLLYGVSHAAGSKRKMPRGLEAAPPQ